MKSRLVGAGIPETKIAFIHDADTNPQKAARFKSVREGRVRIFFGSTPRWASDPTFRRVYTHIIILTPLGAHAM